MSDAEAMLAVNPGDATGLGMRAGALFLLGRVDEAQVDVERALVINPGLAGTRAIHAEILLEQGQHARAIEEATVAYELQRTCVNALAIRARARMKDDPTGARADLERFLQLAPRRPEAPAARAMLQRLKEAR